MKGFLSATAMALVLGLAAGGMTASPAAAKNGETVQDRDNGPQTPLPVYGPRSAGPIYSAGPRLVTVEQPYVVRTGPVMVAPSYQPSYQQYVVTRGQPLIVRQPAPPAYYVYAPTAPVYAVPPLGAAASLRLADMETAAGGSSSAAAQMEFERIDANNDGSISGNEYAYYRERVGRPVYWNY